MANSFGEKLTAATPILTLGVGLLALFLGVPRWWMVFVIGWVVVTPLVAILVGDRGKHSHLSDAVNDAIEQKMLEKLETDDSGASSKQDVLEVLRNRYANGEIGEETFERMVERLLETESLEDAETFFSAGGDGASASRGDNLDRASEAERELSERLVESGEEGREKL